VGWRPNVACRRWRHVRPRRLQPQQRREQLLDTAAAMFAGKPYDDVMVQGIAANAGVSRALIYNYFPSGRDLYVAIFQRASNGFLARVSRHQQLPLADQLATPLDAHIQSLVDHPFEAATINRITSSDDPAMQAIVAEELNVVGHRRVDQLVAHGCPRGAGEILVEGWLAFVRAARVKWIDSQNISRGDLAVACLRAFDCALDIPTPTSRLRARISGVMQSPAAGHDTTRLVALSTARSALVNRKGS
jgi:AcrR family transcriptional regulator